MMDLRISFVVVVIFSSFFFWFVGCRFSGDFISVREKNKTGTVNREIYDSSQNDTVGRPIKQGTQS